MKKTQAAALIAGAAFGLTAVTAGIVLSRAEGRQAAKRLLDKSAPTAKHVRDLSGRVAKSAVAQYQVQAPRAKSALSGVLAQAPQAAEALTAKLPKVNLGAKQQEPVTVNA
ncbi:MAG TPA: hypothetical protein VF120_15445 [Ktedonobacterales bacterium]